MRNYSTHAKQLLKHVGLVAAISIGVASGIAGTASAQSFLGESMPASSPGRIYGFDNVSSKVGGMTSACEARKGGAILGGFVNSDAPSSWNGVCRY